MFRDSYKSKQNKNKSKNKKNKKQKQTKRKTKHKTKHTQPVDKKLHCQGQHWTVRLLAIMKHELNDKLI